MRLENPDGPPLPGPRVSVPWLALFAAAMATGWMIAHQFRIGLSVSADVLAAQVMLSLALLSYAFRPSMVAPFVALCIGMLALGTVRMAAAGHIEAIGVVSVKVMTGSLSLALLARRSSELTGGDTDPEGF